MNFSSMLRSCSPADVLIAIRSTLAERYAAHPLAPQHDPWWQLDPDHETAFGYAPWSVAW